MGRAEEQYQPDEFSSYAELRNLTPWDEPEGQLAPQRQEGGHIISAIAKLLGLGGALEGNWAGQAEGTQSPMYGRKWGEAPIADILGNIDLPLKGAMSLPLAAGFTKLQRGSGGWGNQIAAFHDKTNKWLGNLFFHHPPGEAPIFDSIQSSSPRGTAELLKRFVEEIGPEMNNVQVPGPIKAQSVPAFQSWIDRGRLEPWPKLKANLQEQLDWTRSQLPENIPQSTRGWNEAADIKTKGLFTGDYPELKGPGWKINNEGVWDWADSASPSTNRVPNNVLDNLFERMGTYDERGIWRPFAMEE